MKNLLFGVLIILGCAGCVPHNESAVPTSDSTKLDSVRIDTTLKFSVDSAKIDSINSRIPVE